MTKQPLPREPLPHDFRPLWRLLGWLGLVVLAVAGLAAAIDFATR